MRETEIVEALWRETPARLPEFIRDRRWFAGKARKIRSVELVDAIPIARAAVHAFVLLAKVSYEVGSEELYDIPVAEAQPSGLESADVSPRLKLHLSKPDGVIEFTDALLNAEFRELLLSTIVENNSLPGSNGELRACAGDSLSEYWNPSQRLPTTLNRGEQSNSSILYGNKLILKIFRRLESGVNPDIEIGTFLTDKTKFRNIAPVAGSLEYTGKNGEKMSLGILQGFVANRGDAWEFTLQKLREYFSSEVIAKSDLADLQMPRTSLTNLSESPIPSSAYRFIGEYVKWAELLAERTAELHLALASAEDDEVFKPERFTAGDQHEFAASAKQLLKSTFEVLRDQRATLPGRLAGEAGKLMLHAQEIQGRLQAFGQVANTASKIRIHGDFHLGQVLFTGKDFVIIDFEGEPSRPLRERRKKRSPLQDVAGMLRSFDYAANAQLVGDGASPENLANAATYWQTWVSAAFLRKYREVAGHAGFMPRTLAEFEIMLDTYLLDKAIYELGYELNNRPSWLGIPLRGISRLIGKPA